MNPHQLELFYYVAKARGVTRAVRLMPYGIQQPTVSSQVNALERDLGVSLYERRPFKLTPAGEELFRFVEPFFGHMTEVREKLHGAAQLRIGASPIVFRDYLLPVIDAVRKQFPRLSLILRAMNQPQLLDALQRDELDIVITLIPDTLGPSISSSEIVSLPLVLLVPKRSKIKLAKDLWADGGVTEPLIALAPHELLCQRFQQTLAEMGIRWLPAIEMDSLDLIEQYVAAGYGIGLSVRLPEKKLPAAIRAVDLPGFPSLRLGVLHRRESTAGDTARRAFLAELNRQSARFAKKSGAHLSTGPA